MTHRLHLILCLLLLLAVFAPPLSASDSIPVFIYHRFDEAKLPSTNISAQVFEAQLAYLKQHNYQVLPLGEIARRLQAGEPFPERGVGLCVDDAFTSFYHVAMPILRRYGYPVTLFINTDSVGKGGYLDWQQLRTLHGQGVEFGNHTATHDYLVERKAGEDFARWRERVKGDIEKAQRAFAEQVQIAPRLFAYPYGEYTPELVDLVKEFGFVAAFAQQSGVVHAGSHPYLLPRFPMGGDYATLEGFKEKLAMQPLRVSQVAPFSPLLNGAPNPPVLRLKITDSRADLGRLRCFSQGGSNCRVEAQAGGDGWFEVVADRPLSGRRNKYTLTAPGKNGGWHWYSHLWLLATDPVLSGGN